MGTYPKGADDLAREENERRARRRETVTEGVHPVFGQPYVRRVKLDGAIQALVDALAAGGYNVASSSFNPQAPGSALKVESLEATMKSVTYDDSHLKIAKLRNKPIHGARAKIMLDGKEIGLWKKYNWDLDYAEVPVLGSTAVLDRETINAAIKTTVEYKGYEDKIIVSPQLLDEAERVMAAASPLPNGFIVPSAGTYIPKKQVTCGKCGRLEPACTCYDIDARAEAGPPGLAVEVKTADDMVKVYKPTDEPLKLILDPNTGLLGKCYVCAHPKNVAYKHRVTGVPYCITCGKTHLLPES